MRTTWWLTVVGALALAAPAARAEVPRLLTQQGRLLDGNDVPVTGELEVTFTLYAFPSAPFHGEDTQFWTGKKTVKVSSGVYATVLGDDATNPLPASVFAGPDRFLGVKIGGGAELSPRLQLTSVPFAFVAGDALTLGGEAPDHYWKKSEQVEAATLGGNRPEVFATKAAQDATLASLAATQTDLAATKTDLAATTADLGTTKTDLAATKTDLGTTKTDLAATRQNLGANYLTTASAQTAYDARYLNSGTDDATTGALSVGKDLTVGGRLAGASASFTGPVAVGAPTDPSHAAPRSYVDAARYGAGFYESESLPTIAAAGKVVSDPLASGGSARTGGNGADYLQYGPYTTEQPPGQYVAFFRLRGSGAATIDVYASGGAALGVIAARTVAVGAAYAEHGLRFTKTDAGDQLEFRVYNAPSTVFADYVRVVRDSPVGPDLRYTTLASVNPANSSTTYNASVLDIDVTAPSTIDASAMVLARSTGATVAFYEYVCVLNRDTNAETCGSTMGTRSPGPGEQWYQGAGFLVLSVDAGHYRVRLKQSCESSCALNDGALRAYVWPR